MAILINAFEAEPEGDERFIAGWERTRDYLNKHAGPIPTVLHRCLAPQVEFRFVNIAQIDAVDAWRDAIMTPDFPGRGMPGTPHPALYELVFEDHAADAEAGAVLINHFEVPHEDDSHFMTAWDGARVVLSRQPGYLGTRLHRALEPHAQFRFVNVARWEGQDAFLAAAQQPAFAEATGTMPYRSHPALYEVVSN